MDALIAGVRPTQPLLKASFTGQAAGQYFSTLYTAGLPGAGTAPATGINGAALTAYTGQIPFPAPVINQNVYVAGMDATQANNVGMVLLCDRLWHNSGATVTTTGAQAISFPAMVMRDANGFNAGVAVQLAIEVTTATTNAGAVTNMTASYTNQSGTAGRTATVTSFPANAVAGTFVPFNLAAGDTGVQSVQSITLGTSLVTGAVSFVTYRTICAVPSITANLGNRVDAIQLGVPIMWDNSVPWLVYVLSGTAGGALVGNITFAQG